MHGSEIALYPLFQISGKRCQKRCHFRVRQNFCQQFGIYSLCACFHFSLPGICRSLRCFMNRFSTLSPIKRLLEQIRVMHPVIVQNMGILIRDHLRLCVTGISLNRFDVAAVRFSL